MIHRAFSRLLEWLAPEDDPAWDATDGPTYENAPGLVADMVDLLDRLAETPHVDAVSTGIVTDPKEEP